MTVGYWTMLDAELADTIRSNRNSRPKQPCRYCGTPTRALNRVCLAHDDLPALESADVLTEPHPSASAVSSAASKPHPSGSRSAALDPQPTGD